MSDGIWRTVSGRRIFIENGQTLSEAMSKSGKFKKSDKTKKIKDSVERGVKAHKEEQLKIIQKSNPMKDDYHTGIRKVEDIKTFAEALKDEDNIVTSPDYTLKQAKQALENGEITVYSSYPIENGVFVTPSKMEAKQYAGGDETKLYSQKVKLNEVAWIDNYEGQYAKVNNGNSQTKTKDFGIKEERIDDYWKDIGGKPANKVTFKNNDGRLAVMERGDGTNSIVETYVEPDKRRQRSW